MTDLEIVELVGFDIPSHHLQVMRLAYKDSTHHVKRGRTRCKCNLDRAGVAEFHIRARRFGSWHYRDFPVKAFNMSRSEWDTEQAERIRVGEGRPK